MDKDELRKILIAKRKKDEKKDAFIFGNLRGLSEFSSAGYIFTYISARSEPDTKKIIAEAFRLGKRIAVPVCEKGVSDMKCFEIFPDTVFKEGMFGISEPISSPRADEYAFDLIIAPGLGFDEMGNRIGYGKGYYDIFLKKHPGIKVVALSYESQIEKEIPTDKNDRKVDIIITERRIIRIK